MPRWLRQFTFNKINEFYKKEAEEYEKASSRETVMVTVSSTEECPSMNVESLHESLPMYLPEALVESFCPLDEVTLIDEPGNKTKEKFDALTVID